MDDVKRILVASRSTKDCQEAVHHGVSLARKYGADLYIIHVIYDAFGYNGWNLPIVSIEKEFKKLCQEARQEIDRILSDEKADGLKVHELVREGKPLDEILKTIKEEAIDLLVLSAHPEGRLEHFLFGRTNEQLTRRMPCSIVLVRKEAAKAE